jgi:hypothetical protein
MAFRWIGLSAGGNWYALPALVKLSGIFELGRRRVTEPSAAMEKI